MSTSKPHEKEVLFLLGAEVYAVAVSHVLSIIDMHAITVVPHAPPSVLGVINLRGNVLPVADLRITLSLADGPPPEKQVIMVVSVNSLELGLVVDRVLDVTLLDPQLIEAPSPLLVNVDTALLRGLVRRPEKETDSVAAETDIGSRTQAVNKLIILLDLPYIFSLDKLEKVRELGGEIAVS